MSQTTAPNVSDPIQAAIEQAQATARDQVLRQMAQTTAPAAPQQQSVPALIRPGVPLSMSDMQSGGLAVDGWLGVNEHGLTGGKDKVLVTSEVIVEIDLAMVQPCYAIKFGNNPPTYYKTYDRVLEVRGGSWQAAVERAQKVASGAREYPSADVPMVTAVPITGGSGKASTLLVEAGVSIGYSIATTGWTNWRKFYSECEKSGLLGQTVRVRLEAERRTGNGNTWGVIRWVLAPLAN